MSFISEEIWYAYYGFSAALGIYISILTLFQKRGVRKANFFLAGFIFSLSFFIALELAFAFGLQYSYPHLFGIGLPLWFLIGPLFYFYVILVLNPDRKIKPLHIIHLTPVILYIIVASDFLFLSGEEKLLYIKTPREENILFTILTYMPFVLIVLYFALLVRLINKHSVNYKSFFSNTKIDNIEWMKRLTIAYALYMFFDIVAALILRITGTPSEDLANLFYVMMTVFIHLVAYTSFRYPERIFSSHKINNIKKYKTSNLSEDEISVYLEKLVSFMEKEKPFLNNNLSLPDLSFQIDISTNHLSQIINQKLKMNFYDFINSYRINEAKKRLTDPEFNHISVLGIGLDVGFSNKTSFNKNFKKFTGTTPSSYKISNK